MKKKIIFLSIVLMGFCMASGANLANPAVAIPGARVAIGASYDLGGYTITNQEIPCMFNRIHARAQYAPWQFLAFGIDAGVTQVEVDRYINGSDTIPVFHGNFGFSGGANIKLATPLLFDIAGLVAVAQGTMFNSYNNNDALYGGYDGAGVLGLQFHIKHFGYITAGPMVYLIDGKNRSYTGGEGIYSNVNNVRGWIALEFFPKLTNLNSDRRPYVSVEFSASPKATVSSRIPVQEFSFSVSIGSVTKRLYGVQSDVEWDP